MSFTQGGGPVLLMRLASFDTCPHGGCTDVVLEGKIHDSKIPQDSFAIPIGGDWRACHVGVILNW